MRNKIAMNNAEFFCSENNPWYDDSHMPIIYDEQKYSLLNVAKYRNHDVCFCVNLPREKIPVY